MLNTAFNVYAYLTYPDGYACYAPMTSEMFSSIDAAEAWVEANRKEGIRYRILNTVGETVAIDDVDEPGRVSRRSRSHRPAAKGARPETRGLPRQTVRKGRVL